MFKSISVNDLKYLRDIEIIDIRSKQKYNDRHILNAKNISFEELLMQPYKFLNKDIEYYIYCQKGNRSKQLCTILYNNGYKVINVIGGYEAWILNE